MNLRNFLKIAYNNRHLMLGFKIAPNQIISSFLKITQIKHPLAKNVIDIVY